MKIDQSEITFDELLETIRELKLEPKREIWLTDSVMHKDDKGELVIVKINVVSLNQKRGFYMNLPLYETITGADEIILMNPMTFHHLRDEFEVPQSSNQIVSDVYSIPVFSDEYRRNYFAEKRRNETRPKHNQGS